MTDGQDLSEEVKRARAARSEAEDACCAVEELLWEIRYPRTWRRLAQVDAAETDRPVAH
jgi:hypothetical protein